MINDVRAAVVDVRGRDIRHRSAATGKGLCTRGYPPSAYLYGAVGADGHLAL